MDTTTTPTALAAPVPPATPAVLEALFEAHRLETRTTCGAVSIPLTHHHGAESDTRPGPLRILTCSEDAGHDGDHRDAVCCYRFQRFADWQVAYRKPRAHDRCVSCRTTWPCITVRTIQEASR